MPTIITEESGVAILGVDGELVAATVPQFRGKAQELLNRDLRDYVVDFEKITSIDSAGLEALTWLARSSEERLGSVALCRVSEPFATIMHMTRLDRQFARFASRDEAIASFG